MFENHELEIFLQTVVFGFCFSRVYFLGEVAVPGESANIHSINARAKCCKKAFERINYRNGHSFPRNLRSTR